MSTPLALPPRPARANKDLARKDGARTDIVVLEDEDGASADHSLRRIAWLSVLTIVLGVGGLLTWAALARLDSAVPATGIIVAAGKRKTITLSEGGLLADLLVKEGDQVAAGQVLMRLDDVQIRAAYDQAAAQYWGIIAQAARLQAEASDSRTLRFPDELLRIAATTPAVAAEMEAEQRQFEARLMSFEATRQIPKQRIAEQQAIAGALQVQQREALFRQSLTLSELSGARELYSKGFATRLRVNQLERSAADSRSQLADLAGRTKLIQETIAQILFEMQSSAKSRQTDIVREQAAMESRLAESAGRLQGARDRLDKRMVRAPEAGTVMNLRFYTIGSNVATGQPVLDLEPLDGRRLIEAGVAPTDIEHVRVGQKVNIRLTAYKAHEVPVLTGRLVYVGADRQMDEHNEPVFKVRAEVDEEALKGLQGVTLYAGMPADVLIIGHERTALAYLIGPIRSSLRHAMREE